MSSLRDKMLNYESVPPKNTWDKIAAALDEANNGDQFPHTPSCHGNAPPAMAWERSLLQ